MGNLLDDLLRGGGITTIETEGTPLTKRDTLDFDTSFVVVDNGGDGKTVVSLAEGGGGGAAEAPIVFSAVDTLAVGNNAPQTTAGDQSQGVAFFIRPGVDLNITGIRCHWQSALGETVKCALYSAAGALLKSVNVVTSGAGVYEGTFASPLVCDAAGGGGGAFNRKLIASVHDVAGGTYSFYDKTAPNSLTWPALPFFGGRRIGWMNFALYHAGDAAPDTTANTQVYPVEPILEEL